jgi:hypothetical protein
MKRTAGSPAARAEEERTKMRIGAPHERKILCDCMPPELNVEEGPGGPVTMGKDKPL